MKKKPVIKAPKAPKMTLKKFEKTDMDKAMDKKMLDKINKKK